MTQIIVTLEGRGLEEEISRVLDLTPAMEAGVRRWRKLIEGEFRGGYWQSPGSGRVAWQPVEAFGSRPGGPPLLRTGALLRAYLGTGSGGFQEIGKLAASFGVRGAVFPGAAIHRGGAGPVRIAQARQLSRIRVTPRMRAFLGGRFGVWLRKSTEFIRIPPRPHATDSPELATGWTADLVAYVKGEARRPAVA